MTPTYEGSFDGRRLRVAVVASRFNETIAKRLLNGAIDGLTRHGVADDDILVAWVPGAFELPAAAKRIAESGEVDAIVCVGAVIRGDTPHFEYVAGHAARGIGEAALATGVPITFGPDAHEGIASDDLGIYGYTKDQDSAGGSFFPDVDTGGGFFTIVTESLELPERYRFLTTRI